MARRPRSFAWVRYVDVANRSTWHLSPSAREGYELAEEIYSDHRQKGNFATDRLTVDALAWRLGLATSTLNRKITLAYRELFGDITLDAIRARRRRYVEPLETCAEEGCENRPERRPPGQPGPRPRYCPEHRTGAATTARSRRGSA